LVACLGGRLWQEAQVIFCFFDFIIFAIVFSLLCFIGRLPKAKDSSLA
jgi:hypothetical protein